MAKRQSAAESLRAIRNELASFLDSFDSDDAEDAQLRTDALISSMIKAGVLKESRRVRNFRLDIALETVQLPVPNREAIVARGEMFHDLIASYGGEPDEADMVFARTLLEEIANALNAAISVRMEKEGLNLNLFDPE